MARAPGRIAADPYRAAVQKLCPVDVYSLQSIAAAAGGGHALSTPNLVDRRGTATGAEARAVGAAAGMPGFNHIGGEMSHNEAQVLFENARDKIQQYNQICLHYNLIADAVYRELRKLSTPFSPNYEPYLVAALIAFDIGRMMGEGIAQRYNIEAGGFASRLHRKLAQVQSHLASIVHSTLIDLDIEGHASDIRIAYSTLASNQEDALHSERKTFHVGATKILHFLNPELFAIIDINTAKTLKAIFGIPYKAGTQPGYSDELYVHSLSAIKQAIVNYGVDRFRSLENGAPIMRVFDKIAFAYGTLET